MADDRHNAGIRGDLGGGGLSAFGGTAIIFGLQFDGMADQVAALLDGDFGNSGAPVAIEVSTGLISVSPTLIAS